MALLFFFVASSGGVRLNTRRNPAPHGVWWPCARRGSKGSGAGANLVPKLPRASRTNGDHSHRFFESFVSVRLGWCRLVFPGARLLIRRLYVRFPYGSPLQSQIHLSNSEIRLAASFCIDGSA